MEDRAIIDLYWERQERALEESEQKYGRYCWTIAYNILRDREDSEECVNDTWLRAWNAMPPQRPAILSSFLGTITRNLSLDVALEELEDCLSGNLDTEQLAAQAELSRSIDRFLRQLPEKECCVFLRRYWYVDSTLDIASRYHMAEGTVKSMLHRTRKKLQHYLEQEGVGL